MQDIWHWLEGDQPPALADLAAALLRDGEQEPEQAALAQLTAALARHYVSRGEQEAALAAAREEQEAALAAAREEQEAALAAAKGEFLAERLLLAAKAKNLPAAKALLHWPAGLAEPELAAELQRQVDKLREQQDTAFLFEPEFGGRQDWLGLLPAPASDLPEEGEAGFSLRLAQADGDSLQSIKIKQQAAGQGIFL